MAWVERRVTRTSQPQDAVGIDWSNPITKGLLAVVTGALTRNLATGKSLVPFAAIPVTVLTPKGIVTEFSRNAAVSTETLKNIGTGDYTDFWFGIPTISGSSGDVQKFFLGSDNNQTGIAQYGGGSSTVDALNAWDNTWLRSSKVAIVGEYITTVNTRSAGVQSFWIDKKKEATQASSTNIGAQKLVFGAFIADSYWFSGHQVLVSGRFDRGLSDAEIKSITENPWQIFEPEVIRIWVDDYVSAGGGATVIPIGVQATGSVGTPSATGAARATPAGVSATASVGAPVALGGASIPATALPAGVQATAAVGTVSASGAAVAQPVGVVASSAVGTPVAIAGTSIPATVLPAGVQASGAVGTPAAQGAAIAQPLGVAATAYVGTPTIATGVSGVAVAYPAGVQAIGQVGTLIATGAAWTAAVGVQAVASVGTPTAYAGEIVIYIAGAQTRPSRLQSSSRPSRLQTGTRASR